MIVEGKLKALAVVGPQRSKVLPTVQTFEEAGFKGFVYTNEIWVGVMGPANLDEAVRKKLEETVRATVQEPVVQAFLRDAGFSAIGNSSAEFLKDYRAEVEVIPALIRSLGVVPQ